MSLTIDPTMSKEAAAEDAQLGRDLADMMVAAGDGPLTKQAEAAVGVIRTHVREEGFLRKILPFRDIPNSALDYFGDTELPGIWGEMEPSAPEAKTLSYQDAPDTAFFYAGKYLTTFSKPTTPEFTKHEDELRTYKNDIRAIMVDNMLRDLHTHEDVRWMAAVNRVVGPEVAVGGGITIDNQNIGFTGQSITRELYKKIKTRLTDRRIGTGVHLLNINTAAEFEGFDRQEIGGDLAQEMFLEGSAALDEFKIGGVPHLATIKNDLIANGEVYQFATPRFLGVNYRLSDIKVHIEKKRGIIRFYAQEHIGTTIANTRGVQRSFFPNQRAVI